MNATWNRIRMGALAVGLLACTACTSTLLSLPPGPVPDHDSTKPRHIVAEGSGFQLLLFFPIYVNGRYQEAWDKLSAQAAGDYIADVTIEDTWTYWFVGTTYTVRMEANAYPLIRP